MIVLLALVLFMPLAHGQDDSEWIEPFDGVRYRTQANAFIFEVNRPLMTERLAVYGNVTRDKQGNRIVNTKDESKVTDLGRAIRNEALIIETPPPKENVKGVWMVQIVSLEYNRVTFVKYDFIPDDLVLPAIMGIMEKHLN
jgi:hypothetical protein